jgi:hypothetical protein
MRATPRARPSWSSGSPSRSDRAARYVRHLPAPWSGRWWADRDLNPEPLACKTRLSPQAQRAGDGRLSLLLPSGAHPRNGEMSGVFGVLGDSAIKCYQMAILEPAPLRPGGTALRGNLWTTTACCQVPPMRAASPAARHTPPDMARSNPSGRAQAGRAMPSWESAVSGFICRAASAVLVDHALTGHTFAVLYGGWPRGIAGRRLAGPDAG